MVKIGLLILEVISEDQVLLGQSCPCIKEHYLAGQVFLSSVKYGSFRVIKAFSGKKFIAVAQS